MLDGWFFLARQPNEAGRKASSGDTESHSGTNSNTTVSVVSNRTHGIEIGTPLAFVFGYEKPSIRASVVGQNDVFFGCCAVASLVTMSPFEDFSVTAPVALPPHSPTNIR